MRRTSTATVRADTAATPQRSARSRAAPSAPGRSLGQYPKSTGFGADRTGLGGGGLVLRCPSTALAAPAPASAPSGVVAAAGAVDSVAVGAAVTGSVAGTAVSSGGGAGTPAWAGSGVARTPGRESISAALTTRKPQAVPAPSRTQRSLRARAAVGVSVSTLALVTVRRRSRP